MSAFSSLAPAVVSGAFGLAGVGLSSQATAANNAQLMANQNRINQQQLDFSKNAYTYATADRLRAGLSPLDAQAASTPALNVAETQAADYSQLADVGNNAMDQYRQARELQSVQAVNSSVVAKNQADSRGVELENLVKEATLLDTIQEIRDKASMLHFDSEHQKEIYYRRLEELSARVNNLRADSQYKDTMGYEASETGRREDRKQIADAYLSAAQTAYYNSMQRLNNSHVSSQELDRINEGNKAIRDTVDYIVNNAAGFPSSGNVGSFMSYLDKATPFLRMEYKAYQKQAAQALAEASRMAMDFGLTGSERIDFIVSALPGLFTANDKVIKELP